MDWDKELHFTYLERRSEIHGSWNELVAVGDYQQALALIERALAETEWLDGVAQSDATRSDFYKLMGDSYAHLQNNRLAAKWYIKSLRLQSSCYGATYTRWRSLAAILRKAGKPKWAANCFEKVHDPQHRVYWRWDEAEEAGDWAGALAVIEEALTDVCATSDRVHRVMMLLKKSDAYRELGRHYQAIKATIQAIREWPEYPGGWVSLGLQLEEMGKLHWAKNCFSKAELPKIEDEVAE